MIRGRVVHTDLDRRGNDGAELEQHSSGLAHGARSVLSGLVPRRRDSEQTARIAAAQRADDQIMNACRVLHDGQYRRSVGVRSDDVDLFGGARCVRQESSLERGIGPRSRDEGGAGQILARRDQALGHFPNLGVRHDVLVRQNLQQREK